MFAGKYYRWTQSSRQIGCAANKRREATGRYAQYSNISIYSTWNGRTPSEKIAKMSAVNLV